MTEAKVGQKMAQEQALKAGMCMVDSLIHSVTSLVVHERGFWRKRSEKFIDTSVWRALSPKYRCLDVY